MLHSLLRSPIPQGRRPDDPTDPPARMPSPRDTTMKKMSELPLNLYKSNLELQLKIGKLIQESGREWFDFGHRLIDDGIAESKAEVDELLKTGDWEKLTALPAESFWRQVQQRFGDSQAAAQIAIGAQAAFASGLQEALEAWQKETTQALGENPFAGSLGDGAWADLLKPWEQLLPVASRGKPRSRNPAAKEAR